MSTVSVRIPDDELNAIKAYANFNNLTVSDAIRNAIIEKMEDFADLQVFEEYEQQRAAGTLVTRSIEDFWKELDLEDEV